MKQTVLVTGSEGFIGNRLTRRFMDAGYVVHRLDASRSPASVPGIEGQYFQHNIVEGPCLDLPGQLDLVIHLAGKAHSLADSAKDLEEYHSINTLGTRNVLASLAGRNVKRFVFFSTVKAMGEKSFSRPCDETNETPPDTPYGVSKREAEKLVLANRTIESAVVLRPCLVYGPQPKGNLDMMIRAVMKNRFPPLPEYHNKRSMVHIDDLIEAVLMVAINEGVNQKTYIVADNTPFSTRQLYDWIREAAGMPASTWTVPKCVLKACAVAGDLVTLVRRRRFLFDSDRLVKMAESAWYTSARLQRDTGWRPQRTLRDEMRNIVASVRNTRQTGNLHQA